MATLTLTKVWITLVTEGTSVSAQSGPDRPQTHAMRGDVRTYAGGRQRSVTVIGTQGTFAFMLRDVSLTTIETLRSWMGHQVLVRDHRGQAFYGVFYAVMIGERKEPTLYDVSIELRTVSAPEGV